MITKLRVKFVCVTMLSVGIIFLLLLVAVNVSMTLSIRREADSILNRVIEADGQIERPQTDSEDTDEAGKLADPGRMARISNIKRTFAVRLDHEGRISNIVDNGSSSFTQDEIKKLVEQIVSEGKTAGEYQNHRYLSSPTSYGSIIAFINCTHEEENMNRLLKICMITGSVCILFLLAAAIFLSFWATGPVSEGFKRQKQFIADASHELKTPLAVIGANVSVLEGAFGANQWTGYIQSEVKRMNRLVNDMLRLAKMEHPQLEYPMEALDLSKIALETLLPYECIAFEQGKVFEYRVEPGLTTHGNKDGLIQVLHIFMDNAFKYSEPGGRIHMLAKQERKRICLEFQNTCPGISKEALPHIFERYYREDSSHSRQSGGFGLGLPIARAILERHHAKVRVKSDGASFVLFQIHL